ncbi:MAG: zf-HC2 domain-containing protein, partial [Chloroflexi bacterium]|nr:zf-HC2 domain-containing protein [Chloroflexota bacterium]
MNHTRWEKLLAVYRDLDPQEQARVDAHVRGCRRCAEALNAYRAMDDDLKSLRDPAPNSGLRRWFHARVTMERQEGWMMQEQRTSRPKRFAEVGLIVALSLVALLLVRFVLPTLSSREVRPAGESAVTGTLTPEPTPTLSTPGPGVADILANPPAAGERIELDAYFSGAGSLMLRGGPRPPEDEVLCPINWSAALTDRPLTAVLAVLNGRRSNVLPEGETWLVAVTPEQMQPGVRSQPQLPYHARLKGYLGEPAYGDCADAARIFVVEEVVEVYQENPPEASDAQILESYATWPRYHDAALGYSLPYPPEWEIEQLGDNAISIYPPEWPGYAVVERVHEGETHYDQYDPAAAPPLLQGVGWTTFQQGLAFDGAVDSQHLAGYAVERNAQPGEQNISVLLNGQGRTYELSLRYPLGFATQQSLLIACSLMVEGFRLDQLPEPSPTPPVKQELGQGPFLSREEVLARVRQERGEAIELLDAWLV